MKGVVAIAGVSMITAAVAVLLGGSRVTGTAPERPVRLVSVPQPESGRGARRRCVRLGWKTPYWYAGGLNREAFESLRH